MVKTSRGDVELADWRAVGERQDGKDLIRA